jgi:hypothetical protein
MEVKAFAALKPYGPDAPLERFTYQARALGPLDVSIAIERCGVCHSDIHAAANDWGGTRYPLVPGQCVRPAARHQCSVFQQRYRALHCVAVKLWGA